MNVAQSALFHLKSIPTTGEEGGGGEDRPHNILFVGVRQRQELMDASKWNLRF